MILLDDSFASIVVGVRYGRMVFENLKKVIMYLLPAGSWSEMMPVLANVFIGIPQVCECRCGWVGGLRIRLPSASLQVTHSTRTMSR